MIADMVTVFMNSARKNSANRIERVLGVEAADELLLGLDEVERRAVQLGVPAITKMTNGHHAGDHEVPAGHDAAEALAGLDHHDVVGGQRPGEQHDGHDRQPRAAS